MLISALAWRTISPSRSTLTLSRLPVSDDLRFAADIELLVAAFDVDALLAAAAGFVVALEAPADLAVLGADWRRGVLRSLRALLPVRGLTGACAALLCAAAAANAASSARFWSSLAPS